MKITRIKAWKICLPLKEGRYNWSNDNFVEAFDSTVVAIETDADIVGYAECCPLGSAYLPAYAHGVRAGLEEIGPKLIGSDPTDLDILNRHMDAVLRGHPYVKAPIDIACWDIFGKATGLPVYKLLGGAAQDGVALYRAISQEAPEVMARKIAGYKAEGYTKFQLKVGGLTKARLMRDICVASGTPMTIEDTWGGDIVTATIAHLARSTPEEFCFSATDFNSYGTVDTATGAPKRTNGCMTASDEPGLGITPIFDVLGDPVVAIG